MDPGLARAHGLTVVTVGLEADGRGGGRGRRAPRAARPLPGRRAVLESGLGGHFESVCSGAAAHLLDGVPGGLEEDDVHLVEEEAGQETKAGRQYGDHLHRRYKLAVGAEVRRDE